MHCVNCGLDNRERKFGKIPKYTCDLVYINFWIVPTFSCVCTGLCKQHNIFYFLNIINVWFHTSHGRFFGLNPPPGISSLASYFPLKNLAFEPPLTPSEFQWGGYEYFLEPHNVNFVSYNHAFNHLCIHYTFCPNPLIHENGKINKTAFM